MATTPTVFPARFSAGTTLKVTRTFSDYSPADGWAASLYLAGPNLLPVVAGTTNGTGFDFTLTAASTALLVAGDYTIKVIATKGVEKFVAEEAAIRIDANIALAGAGDLLAFASKALPIVEAAILGRLTSDQQSFQIAGRAVVKIPIRELFELRIRFNNEISAARANRRGRFGRQIRTTFTPLETES